MGLLLSESFGAGIPGGFATAIADGGGTFTVTHNAGESAVDFSRPGPNALWRLDTCPAAADLRVRFDLEVITADLAAAAISGFGASFKAASATPLHHVIASTQDQAVYPYMGSVASPNGNATTDVPGVFQPIAVAGRYVYEFVCVRRAGASQGGRQYQIRVDDVLLWYADVGTFPAGDLISPYFFIRDSAFRMHSVEVYDDATEVATAAMPVICGHQRAVPLRLFGRAGIAGTVRSLSTPVGGRVVAVMHRDSRRVIRTTVSAPDGTYSFPDLAPSPKYVVVALDSMPGGYNAAIADYITAA